MKEAPLTKATPSFLSSLSLLNDSLPLHILVPRLTNVNNGMKVDSRAHVEAAQPVLGPHQR